MPVAPWVNVKIEADGMSYKDSFKFYAQGGDGSFPQEVTSGE
jgi:hypothetical protein